MHYIYLIISKMMTILQSQRSTAGVGGNRKTMRLNGNTLFMGKTRTRKYINMCTLPFLFLYSSPKINLSYKLEGPASCILCMKLRTSEQMHMQTKILSEKILKTGTKPLYQAPLEFLRKTRALILDVSVLRTIHVYS